jgi:major membrane immunogen (membrane-anchored lipoprotein)
MCNTILVHRQLKQMAKPKKKGGPIQKLSPKGKKDKAERDLKIAMTPARKDKRRENQNIRNKVEKTKGKLWLLGKDYDHKDGKFKSVNANRGNDGNGTKKEKK